MKPYCKKAPFALLSCLVFTEEMDCKARHLAEEIEEKENADFHLFLCQVFYSHNSFAYH